MKNKAAVTLIALSWIILSLCTDLSAAPQKIGALGRLKPSGGILALSVPPGNIIVSVLAKRGYVVRKGTPLLTIQDSGQNKLDVELADLDLKEILSTTKKSIEIKTIEVQIAQMEYDHAASALKRLLEGGNETYSAQGKEDREHILRTTKSKLEVAQQEMGRLEAEKETKTAKAHMKLEAAKKKLRQTSVVAPIDGTILEIIQSAGDVGGSGPALKMADLRRMDAVIEVFEGDVLKLSPGLKASITSKSLPAPLTGKIISIGQIVSPQSRNSEVVIRLDDPKTAAKLINLEVNVSIDLK
jgi:multidrug efflux pump subunit AcrA (membrane-fusion protein)